jgi:c-di-GMP-binding flagellar brake protein YcgR
MTPVPTPERRNHPRYEVKDNILLFNGTIFAEIVNISMGGIFCRFLTDIHDQPTPIRRIDLINASEKIFLQEVTCKDLNWSDTETRQLFHSTALRNCRLKFNDMDAETKAKLLQFVNSVVTSKQPDSSTFKHSAASEGA